MGDIRTEMDGKVLVVVSEAQYGAGLRLAKHVGDYLTVTCPFISRGRSHSRSLVNRLFS